MLDPDPHSLLFLTLFFSSVFSSNVDLDQDPHLDIEFIKKGQKASLLVYISEFEQAVIPPLHSTIFTVSGS